MKNIEKVISVEEKGSADVAAVKTISPTTVPVPRQQLSPTAVPVPRQQRLIKPVRSPHLKVSVAAKPTFSRKVEFESVDLRAHRALSFRTPSKKVGVAEKKKKPSMRVKFQPVIHF